VSYGILLIRQRNDPGGRYQLGDGEEQLMIPLGVEVVVPVINVNPPRVIIGEQSGREEEHHGLSQSLFDRQFRQMLHCLVKRNHSDDDEYPYFQHVRSGIKVHVFVRSDTGFVRACEKVSVYIVGSVGGCQSPGISRILAEIFVNFVTFKDSVPARAGAVPFVHDPRIILPEII